MAYKTKETGSRYSSLYFKERYANDKKFRERRKKEATGYYYKKKRNDYISAIEYFRDMLASGKPADLLVDEVMEKYKIIERK